MITVLWVMTVAAVVTAAGALAGRLAVHASRNRAQRGISAFEYR